MVTGQDVSYKVYWGQEARYIHSLVVGLTTELSLGMTYTCSLEGATITMLKTYSRQRNSAEFITMLVPDLNRQKSRLTTAMMRN